MLQHNALTHFDSVDDVVLQPRQEQIKQTIQRTEEMPNDEHQCLNGGLQQQKERTDYIGSNNDKDEKDEDDGYTENDKKQLEKLRTSQWLRGYFDVTVLPEVKSYKGEIEKQFKQWYESILKKAEVYDDALNDEKRPGQALSSEEFAELWHKISSEKKVQQFGWSKRTILRYQRVYKYKDEIMSFYEKIGKDLFIANGIRHDYLACWDSIIKKAINLGQGTRKDKRNLYWNDELAKKATEQYVEKIIAREKETSRLNQEKKAQKKQFKKLITTQSDSQTENNEQEIGDAHDEKEEHDSKKRKQSDVDANKKTKQDGGNVDENGNQDDFKKSLENGSNRNNNEVQAHDKGPRSLFQDIDFEQLDDAVEHDEAAENGQLMSHKHLTAEERLALECELKDLTTNVVVRNKKKKDIEKELEKSRKQIKIQLQRFQTLRDMYHKLHSKAKEQNKEVIVAKNEFEEFKLQVLQGARKLEKENEKLLKKIAELEHKLNETNRKRKRMCCDNGEAPDEKRRKISPSTTTNNSSNSTLGFEVQPLELLSD